MQPTTTRVDWFTLKKEIKPQYSNTIFAAIEKNETLKKACERVSYPGGEVIIDPKKEVDAIYIIIKGTIAIGDKIKFNHKKIPYEYFVEMLLLKPFSFIGEIEAPLQINTKQYKKIKSPNYAWVTSDVLSKIMAYDANKRKMKVPSDTKSQAYQILTELINDGSLVFEKAYLENIVEVSGNNIDITNARDILELLDNKDIDLMSDIKLFTKNSAADLLKIPLCLSQKLWNDKKIRKYMCEDAFVKSKKYWLLPHDDKEIKPFERLAAIYNHAELNDLLVDDSFYIFGIEKLRAIIDDNDVLVGITSRAKKILKTNYNLILESIHPTAKTTQLSDSNLQKYFRYLSAGQGANKTIYKISRMSDT